MSQTKPRVLADDIVRAIRKEYDETKHLSTSNPKRVTIIQLGKKYGRSRNSIWKIVNRYSYEDVKDEPDKNLG